MKTSNCSCRGKPLSDPISVELGIGPVCRIEQKTKSSSEKTGNLFDGRSKWTFWVSDPIIFIEDCGGFKSLTNDMDNVLRDVASTMPKSIFNSVIIYKDSMGVWDGVEIIDESLRFRFYSPNETSEHKAATKALMLRSQKKALV